ncbi:LytR C-terminal domain-containing protein [Paeniglutamicibacter sp. MACA_103]|uniref:LytR C-terminal domain-containing protein n=1 Tax=Paeniglutamicibacter sp. MACA_103 TaxID=3377337 RepID=UPI003895B705
MTNYPRDEFDRVPEFSNRSGSHRENGWAAAASVGGARSGLRWLMVFGAIALVVGLFSFMVLPKLTGTPSDPASVAASSSGTQEATAPSEASESPSKSEASEKPAESESAESADSSEAGSSTEASETPLAEDVDSSMAMGVYNGATVGGLAGKARTELQNAGFSNVVASNWTKKVTYSTVYFRSETHRPTAEAAAEELGITSVMQSANIPGNIAIVLGSNFR